MIGLRVVKELWWHVKPFAYNTETWRTDKETDRQNSYINDAR